METKKQPLRQGKFFPTYPIDKLEMVKENREVLEKNLSVKMDSLREFGWLDIIKINRNGKILDGQHRFICAKRLGESTIPVYQIDWVDDDVDLVCKVLRVMNNTTLVYKTLDYVEMYKDHKTPYHHLNLNLKNSKTLTTGNIVQAMTNIASINNEFKEGKISLVDKEYYTCIINNLEFLQATHGKINASRLRKVILFCHANSNLGKKFVTYLFESVSDYISRNLFLDEIEISQILDDIKSDYDFDEFDRRTDETIANIKTLSEQINFK